MMSLKVENDRMQRIIIRRGVDDNNSTPSTPPTKPSKEERLSLGDPSNYGRSTYLFDECFHLFDECFHLFIK